MSWKPRTGQTIDRLFAWVAVEADGGEGVMAFQTELGNWVPMVGADTERIESLRPVAMMIAKETNLSVKLVEFSALSVLEVHVP